MAVKPALEPAPAQSLHSTSEEHDSQAPVSEDVFTAPFGNYKYAPSPLRRRQVGDDAGLEREADLMGARTLQMMAWKNTPPSTMQSASPSSLNVGLPGCGVIQRMKFNDAGDAMADAWGDEEEFSHDTGDAQQFDAWLQTLDVPVGRKIFDALDELDAPQRHEAIAKSKAMLKISSGEAQDFNNPLLRTIPETQWWKLFIDKGAQNADESNSVNALRFDNENSPGYLSAMMKSFGEHVAAVVPGNRDRIGAAEYAEMHRQVAAGTLKQEGAGFIQMPQARSGMNTSFGVLSSPGDAVHDHDLNLPSLRGFREMVTEGLSGTRVDVPQGAAPAAGASSIGKYNYKARSSTDARGAGYRPITQINSMGDNFRANTNYAQDGGAALIQGILDRYYAEIAAAGTPEQKLQSIVKAIRALHVGHFFEDANGRLNTMTLLNRFLVEERLQPVIMDSTAIFGGGFSIDQLVGQVVRGMRTFGAVAGIEENDLPAVDVRRVYQNGGARFVFAEEMIDEGIGFHVMEVRKYTIGYTNLPEKAQEIIHHYVALAESQTGNDTTGKLFFLNPKIAERLEHQLEAQIL